MTEEHEGTATYSPEDNKLRLYVGRVPRNEYLRLRAEGWTSTPKQSCDFVATWTPQRRDTALEYAGIIEDEDQSPEDRAADRAERFGEYRDKRTAEATGHADRFDAGPAVFGYQNASRGERAARRHDRIAGRACDAWSKAEYWQRRTAGVIAHALYKSTPGVRMGRIKTLEAELRKIEAALEKYEKTYRKWQAVAKLTDPADKRRAAYYLAQFDHSDYTHPTTGKSVSLYRIAEDENISPDVCAEIWLAEHSEPVKETDWTRHLTLRIGYENQMLEAQGGRLEQSDVQPGGKIGGKLILKVSKSPATGRVTSASLLGPKVSGWAYKTSNIPGTEWAEYRFDLERIDPSAYTAPTPESLAELAQVKAAIKGATPKKDPCPLINPTDADAERLQAIWNAQALSDREASYKRLGYSLPVTDCKPQTVVRITQAQYSAASKGTYGRAETRGVFRGGLHVDSYYGAAEKMHAKYGREVCQVRLTFGSPTYSAHRVIILTDKPQKPLPAAVWELSDEEKAIKAAERARQYEELDAKRAAAGAVSVNGETGELCFK